MYLLAVKGFENDGAFALDNEEGDRVLMLFEEEDVATRYSLMLLDEDYPEMNVVEVDAESAIGACERWHYEYNIVSSNDIVVPPPKKNDNVSED